MRQPGTRKNFGEQNIVPEYSVQKCLCLLSAKYFSILNVSKLSFSTLSLSNDTFRPCQQSNRTRFPRETIWFQIVNSGQHRSFGPFRHPVVAIRSHLSRTTHSTMCTYTASPETTSPNVLLIDGISFAGTTDTFSCNCTTVQLLERRSPLNTVTVSN